MFLIVLIIVANICFYLFTFTDIAFLRSEMGKKTGCISSSPISVIPYFIPRFFTCLLQAHALTVKTQINRKAIGFR